MMPITMLPPPDKCPYCRAAYTNIGHPLKPGVIMQRVCKCRVIVKTVKSGPNSISVTLLVPPPSWRRKVLSTLIAGVSGVLFVAGLMRGNPAYLLEAAMLFLGGAFLWPRQV
jgi:hypothetical protein